MNILDRLDDRIFDPLEEIAARPILTTMARFTFAATLLFYYWASALTKLGDGVTGIFRPSTGAYAQILPRAFDMAGYDASRLPGWQHAIVLAGTWAEFLLPALLVLGLATRPAAWAMIGFVLVQTATDLFGHGALGEPATLGAWFDRMPDAQILDLRLVWITLLLVPALMGGGPLSLDALLRRRASRRAAA
jgi:putative oxidoreductase